MKQILDALVIDGLARKALVTAHRAPKAGEPKCRVANARPEPDFR
jgi:hypothetical protein